MSDRLGEGIARLNARLKSKVSKTYTYRRGAYSVSLECVEHAPDVGPLTTLALAVAERDFVNPSALHVDRPFSFNAEDLILNGSQTTPADGDTIERTIDGVLVLLKLMPPLDGTAMWRYSPENRTEGEEARIRINTRFKS